MSASKAANTMTGRKVGTEILCGICNERLVGWLYSSRKREKCVPRCEHDNRSTTPRTKTRPRGPGLEAGATPSILVHQTSKDSCGEAHGETGLGSEARS